MTEQILKTDRPAPVEKIEKPQSSSGGSITSNQLLIAAIVVVVIIVVCVIAVNMYKKYRESKLAQITNGN